MRAIKLLSLVVTCLCGGTLCLAAPEPDKPITVRVASYNVEFGKSATPENIGEMFKPYKLDIIGFDEAPDGDWTARVGKVHPDGSEAWWDLSSKSLSGANFSVPPPNSKGTRGLNIAYVKKDDDTLTVYVLWHET